MLTINFAWIGLFIIIGVLLFLLHNIFGLDLFSRHDNKVIEQFLKKYPAVSLEFMQKTLKEQSIENNQELWEHDKKLCKVEERLDVIEKRLGNG